MPRCRNGSDIPFYRITAIERMQGWKGACRNRLREELDHQLVSVLTAGGGTVEACTKLR